MSSESKTWGEKFKDALDLKTIALVLLIIWNAGEKIWSWIEVGAEVEFQNKIIEAYKAPAVKEAVKIEFKNNIKDPTILSEVLASPSVDNFSKEAGEKIEKQIVTNVLKEDSTKISFVVTIGQKADIRNDKVIDKIADVLIAWNKGELMTKAEAERYFNALMVKTVRREVKTEALNKPSF